MIPGKIKDRRRINCQFRPSGRVGETQRCLIKEGGGLTEICNKETGRASVWSAAPQGVLDSPSA